MTLLYNCRMDDAAEWTGYLREHLPDLEVRVWPDVGDVADIEYTLVWLPQPGDLRRYPNLKAILSLGAGVDHIFADPELPEDVPIARIVDLDLAAQMSECVIHAVLHFHRNMPAYEELRRQRRWEVLDRVETRNRRVGIMGQGVIGSDASRKLMALGFDVLGWCLPPWKAEGVRMFYGPDDFKPFLAETDILVCLLPLTDQTRGIINKDTLAALPAGAHVVNIARGGHVVDEDLIAALDSGHIAGAALDVFNEEPLPPDHPYWTHPKMIMTPHAGGASDPHILAAQIADNIRRVREGRPLRNVVDRAAQF